MAALKLQALGARQPKRQQMITFGYRPAQAFSALALVPPATAGCQGTAPGNLHPDLAR